MNLNNKYEKKYKNLYMLKYPSEEHADFYEKMTKFKRSMSKEENKMLAYKLVDEFQKSNNNESIIRIFKEYAEDLNKIINRLYNRNVMSEIKVDYFKKIIGSSKASRSIKSIVINIPSILLASKMYDESIENIFKTVYLHEVEHLFHYQDTKYLDKILQFDKLGQESIRMSLDEFIDYCNVSFYNEIYASEFAVRVCPEICIDYLEVCLYSHWVENLKNVILFDDYSVGYIKHRGLNFINIDI